MQAWHGKTLRIDLTTQTTRVETVDPQMAKDYLGGRGWAIKYLMDGMDPRVDPLSPQNMLVMATGPLTATNTPTGNRYMVVTKSPLTGALTDSNSGGYFPTEMKRTGFDCFIFEGKSAEPVYLWVNNDTVEIRPAGHLWGKTVPETEDQLISETDAKARVACIGPAGENLVRIASIMNDKHRAAGRSGVGAVMGSKNLKAVVVRGTLPVQIAAPDEMEKVCKAMAKKVGDVMKAGAAMRVYGTSYVPPITNEMGILPTRNFQSGRFEGIKGITGDVINEKFLKKPKPCYRCPIACGRDTKVDDPKYAGEGEGPEYETIAAYGSACGVDNMAAIIKANYLCNELGLDTISAGMTIACAMEMAEKGHIPLSHIGFNLHFGDPDAMIDLTRQMAYRQGFGNSLAEGSFRLAEQYGHPELAVTARKQEFPGYDPRGAQGMGLLYATSNKGASHMAGDLAYSEVFGVPEKIDPLTTERKPELIMRFEDAFAVVDATGICVFLSVRYMFDPKVELWPTPLAEIMRYATGEDYTPETLLRAGERIFNLERLFLLRAGFTGADDTLPERMLKEPLPEGPAKGYVVQLDRMLPEFYKVRGWDSNGVPTPEKLKELGLTEYAQFQQSII
ncbi:MAG: aldehyde ferredoxin oxidoreductase [Chloroflexi bacterium HGW-Chloroflexi-10]|nr:MAG: aldehyde ferredoxin oxidoreductase [Chloroflexi bacterium HGW-Chloroflexi-10]